MTITGRHAWRGFGVLAAIGLVVALGNSRAPVAEAVASTVRQTVFLPASPDRIVANVVASEGVDVAQVGADADGGAPATEHTDSTDEAHLVPAIYAWDPDVRFVYFRHVSKWM